MKRNWILYLALLCVVDRIWFAVLGQHTAKAEFMDYNFAFTTGDSILTVMDANGKTTEVPVNIAVRANSIKVSWKGKIPKGVLFLQRNKIGASRLPSHIAGVDAAMIKFADVPKPFSEEKTVVLCFASVQGIVNQERKKKVALVDLQYLYGVKKTYLNCSLVSVAARLMETGHKATLVDFNMEEYENTRVQRVLDESDIIGISLLGAPYFPSAIEFTEQISKDFPGKTIAVGGQVVEHISRDAFRTLFQNQANIKQIVNDFDFAALVGENIVMVPSPLMVSFRPVWEEMDPERLRRYMLHEMTLEVSRGCAFNCDFCAARKDEKEIFRGFRVFEQDLRFLGKKAKEDGIKELKFYASSLDFFQTPEKIGKMLCALALVQEEMGTAIKVRCLSCMTSFLHAQKVIGKYIQSKSKGYEGFGDFSELLRRAGLYCIGFGVDGVDETIWTSQNKRHNKIGDVPKCINSCRDMGIRTEILMVLGFPKDSLRTLWKTVRNSCRYASKSREVVLRPYLAKTFVPGNKGWTPERERMMIADPQRFYNIDYCAVGSPVTHPKRWQRWASNLAYLCMIGFLRPFGRCCSIPLLPQGEKGIYGAVAKIFNRIMPCDR